MVWVTEEYAAVMRGYMLIYYESGADKKQVLADTASAITALAAKRGKSMEGINLHKKIRNWFNNSKNKPLEHSPAETDGTQPPESSVITFPVTSKPADRGLVPDLENMTSKRLKNYFTKNWKKNTVAATLHKERFDAIRLDIINKAEKNGPFDHLKATNTARAALWESLTDEEKGECKEFAQAWNKGVEIPRNVQQLQAEKRLADTARSFVADADSHCGAHIFMLVSYETSDGQACIQRFETKSRNLTETFVDSKGNGSAHSLILGAYRDWSAGVWLESNQLPTPEPLMSSNGGYPKLLKFDQNQPGHNNTLLRLTVGQFVRAVCKFDLGPDAVPPWKKMGESPDQVLDRKYYPSMFKWHEISHMRIGDIKALYRYWIGRQNYDLDPLHFIGAKVIPADTSEKQSSDLEAAFQSSYARRKQSDSERDDDDDDTEEDDDDDGNGDNNNKKEVGKTSPPDQNSSSSGKENVKKQNKVLDVVNSPKAWTWSEILVELSLLSKNMIYQRFLTEIVAKAVENGDNAALGAEAPTWISQCDDLYAGRQYLPACFFQDTGADSLERTIEWLKQDAPHLNTERTTVAGQRRTAITAYILGNIFYNVELAACCEDDSELPLYIKCTQWSVVPQMDWLMDACRAMIEWNVTLIPQIIQVDEDPILSNTTIEKSADRSRAKKRKSIDGVKASTRPQKKPKNAVTESITTTSAPRLITSCDESSSGSSRSLMHLTPPTAPAIARSFIMVQIPEAENLTTVFRSKGGKKRATTLKIPAAADAKFGIDLNVISAISFQYARFIGLGPLEITMLSSVWYNLVQLWVEVEGRMSTLNIVPGDEQISGLPSALEKWLERVVKNPDEEYAAPKIAGTAWKAFRDCTKMLLIKQKAAELSSNSEAAVSLFIPGMGGIMGIMLGTFWLGKFIIDAGTAEQATSWDYHAADFSELMNSWLSAHPVQ